MIKRFDELVFGVRDVKTRTICYETSSYIKNQYYYYNVEDPTGDLMGDIEYTTIKDKDKIMFSKNSPFPSSLLNKLDLPIKKVIKNPTKIIIPNNVESFWKYSQYSYILKVRGINIHVSKYNIYKGQTILDIAKAFNAESIIRIYYIRNKNVAELLETISNNTNKLVSHYNFVKYFWENSPKLDKDTWESIKALLESGDSNNVKIASDLLFQFDFSKYLMHIKYAVRQGAKNMPNRRYIDIPGYLQPVRNYSTFKYLTYVMDSSWDYLLIPKNKDFSHYNVLHDFYHALLDINDFIDNKKVLEKYKIDV